MMPLRRENPKRKAEPFVSVVTVVLDEPAGLAATIDSVRTQTFADREHLVIDGGSREETLRVIEDRLAFLDVVVSEPDRGIYNAMNKAVSLARGRWVIFLNAGDRFERDDVLERFRPGENSDLVYGDALWNERPARMWTRRPIEELWKGMAFSHQALFARREVLRELAFREDLRVAADYDFVARCRAAGKRFEALDFIVARIEPQGLSDTSPYRRTVERLGVARRAFPDKPVMSHYLKLLAGFARRDLGAIVRGRKAS